MSSLLSEPNLIKGIRSVQEKVLHNLYIFPSLSPNSKANRAEFEMWAQCAWEKIPQAHMQSCIESNPNRLRAVIKL